MVRCNTSSPQLDITIGCSGWLRLSTGRFSMATTTSCPLTTRPNTTCFLYDPRLVVRASPECHKHISGLPHLAKQFTALLYNSLLRTQYNLFLLQYYWIYESSSDFFNTVYGNHHRKCMVNSIWIGSITRWTQGTTYPSRCVAGWVVLQEGQNDHYGRITKHKCLTQW